MKKVSVSNEVWATLCQLKNQSQMKNINELLEAILQDLEMKDAEAYNFKAKMIDL